MTGFLITFTPCGHVHHWHNSYLRPGMWISCNWTPEQAGCQTQRKVKAVGPCPGCPDCWRQDALFTPQEVA